MRPTRHLLARRRFLAALFAASFNGAALGQTEPAPIQRRVVFIAQDFRNGGITTVYRSFEQACQELGWTLRIVNGKGDKAAIRKLFDEALAAGVDGIVLGGFDESDIADRLAASARPLPALVGWHALDPVNGNLWRFDTAGQATLIGSGFSTNSTEMAFGPDGALYVGDFDHSLVLRVAAVPEPGSWALLLAGAGMMAGRTRRRTP